MLSICAAGIQSKRPENDKGMPAGCDAEALPRVPFVTFAFELNLFTKFNTWSEYGGKESFHTMQSVTIFASGKALKAVVAPGGFASLFVACLSG